MIKNFKLVVRKILNFIRKIIFLFSNFFFFLFCKYIKKPSVVYLGSINHSNLGDHAICISALKLMKNHGIKCVDIMQRELTKNFEKWIERKRICIALRGCGNIGNVWLREEEFHRYVIKRFPNNKILFFPESIFFTEDDLGKKESLISSKIYSSHRNLTIFVRDKISFERALNLFDRKIIRLVPDIVFYLRDTIKKKEHKNLEKVLFLIRNDKETNKENSKILHELIEYFKIQNVDVEISNTISSKRIIGRTSRNRYLNRFFAKMLSADLIVTDRLHGMIFSYCLDIPFIAFDNSNKKVKSSFEWIQNSGYGVFYTGQTDFLTLIEKSFSCKGCSKFDFSSIIASIKK